MHSDAAALSKASIWHEALRIVNEEGFRAFWKGNLVTIAHRLPYSSVNFYAYEHYKSVSMNILRIYLLLHLKCSLLVIVENLKSCPFFLCRC